MEELTDRRGHRSKTLLLDVADKVERVATYADSVAISLTRDEVLDVATAKVAFAALPVVSEVKALVIDAASVKNKSEVTAATDEAYAYTVPTHRTEIGGEHAHHLVGNEWVDTDCNWYFDGESYYTGEWLGEIRLDGKFALSLTLPDSDGITLMPKKRNKKATATAKGNCIVVTEMWAGIDLLVYLTPEGVNLSYLKTADGDNPAWSIQKEAEKFMRGGESYAGEDGTTVEVPASLRDGIYSLNMSSVPVGVTVR